MKRLKTGKMRERDGKHAKNESELLKKLAYGLFLFN